MISKQKVEQELEQLQGLTTLVETYETIAGASVRRIRGSVLANRAFHVGLNRMYHEITIAHQKEAKGVMAKKKNTNLHIDTLFTKPAKQTVLMLLSANTGLYGDVIGRIFIAFITEIKRTQADIMIIGRMGKMFFEEAMPGKEFTYFDFPDNAVSMQNLKEISTFLLSYEKVIAFYAIFKNLLTQQVRASIVSGNALPAGKIEDASSPQSYRFEPSLEEVTLFFEKEIFASLLEQVFQESRLAKLASRMVLLDRAMINIENELTRVILQKYRLRHRAINRQLLDSLSGSALWG